MVELIITIAILSFGIIGVYAAFSPTISVSYTIKNRLAAAYLAQEGLEIVRNIRDANFIAGNAWSDGLLNCQVGCQATYKTGTAVQGPEDQMAPYNGTVFLVLGGDGFYGYATGGKKTPFTRKITITPISGDTLKVNTAVFWSHNGQQSNFQTETYLYDWF